jgi:hypothetical protein
MTKVITPIESFEDDADDFDDEVDFELDETSAKSINSDTQVKAKSNRGNAKPTNRKLTQALIESDRELAIEITCSRILDAFRTLEDAQTWLAVCWQAHEQKRFARIDSLTGDLSTIEKQRLLERLKAELQPVNGHKTKDPSA